MVKSRAKQVLNSLNQLYPEAESELHFRNKFQLLVAVMLSAQCTDKKVNEVTPSLFREFSSFKKLSQAKLTELEAIIRPINYYKTKAKNLIAMSNLVVEQFSSRVPKTHEELTSLPGVGNKTANVVLSELGYAHALPVDTHVQRVSMRLGLSSGKSPDSVEVELKKSFAPETWRTLHHGLIFHGRRICKAQRPLCDECQLATICPKKKVHA